MTTKRPFFPIIIILLTISIVVFATASRETAVAEPQADPITPAYGINFISSAEMQGELGGASEQRYQNGLSTGATWNRWPLYWNKIEQSQGGFHWEYQDLTVIADIAHGLKIDAILLGTPAFYRTGTMDDRTPIAPAHSPMQLTQVQTAAPQGLYKSVFTDGTDIPGAGKSINPANVWARFVQEAVNRYKPDGIIAQEQGWVAGEGITHWEMWNEPDLDSFWDGSLEEYARLLKVGYLAAKHADPDAQIISGGMAVYEKPAYYTDLMILYDSDPLATANHYFHDIYAVHNYGYAWRSWYYVFIGQNRLNARGLDSEIWLNESGVPVWDDYPGPICDPTSSYRATMSEQADFIIQSALYATYGGADNLFFFQLYDDCGNQQGGTNHDWYDQSQCTGDNPGGDAFGLFSNATDAACYRDHPNPESGRTGAMAFQTLTHYFQGVDPLWRLRLNGTTPYNGTQELIAFYHPASGERIVGLWARDVMEETAVFTTTNSAGTAVLVAPDGVTQTITAVNNLFTITLPGATNANHPGVTNPIGGRPFLLIEPDTLPPDIYASAPLTATGTITVEWGGTDWGSGMAAYNVSVSMDGGAFTGWLTETTAVSAVYPVVEGHTYTFAVSGVDNAGNWSGETAVTVFALDLPYKTYLPAILREN